MTLSAVPSGSQDHLTDETEVAERHTRLYRRWLYELWNGDLAVAEEICASDFVGHWPHEPAKVRGPHALAAVVDETRAYFDQLDFIAELGPVVQGDLVAARWRGRGSIKGSSVSLAGHDFLRVRDGRFSEYWVIAEQPG